MKALLLLLTTISLGHAQLSKLNSDPKVIYTQELTSDKIIFKVKEARRVFSSKTGQNRLGVLQPGTHCELIGFDQRAFKVKAMAQHGPVTGWVSPYALSCNDDKFVEHFQQLYTRQLTIKDLIKKQKIAIGMTPAEVVKALGKPTKTKLRRTAKGSTGTYEFIEYYEKKHYTYFQDPVTGQTVRNFTHATQEVKTNTIIEFTNDAVSAIEETVDNSGNQSRPTIVSGPIYWNWRDFLLY